MITPKIVTLEEKKLIGISTEMSLVDNKTGQLWRQFGPKIKEIKNRISADKISMQIYPDDYYQNFSPVKSFTKWATVEVANYDNLASEMQTFTLNSGLYAVFNYKGSSADSSIYQYIFQVWIPKSEYTIDNRPHFEVLGEKYINNHPNSEEEIWIPIKPKTRF